MVNVDGWWKNALWKNAFVGRKIKSDRNQKFLRKKYWRDQINIYKITCLYFSSVFKSSSLSRRHRIDTIDDLLIQLTSYWYNWRFIDTIDEISVPLIRMESEKFSHQPKRRSNHGQLDVILPLPMVFEVPEQVVGPLKDTNHVPVFNGRLDVEKKRVLIYDLPSAQVCFKAFDRILTEE